MKVPVRFTVSEPNRDSPIFSKFLTRGSLGSKIQVRAEGAEEEAESPLEESAWEVGFCIPEKIERMRIIIRIGNASFLKKPIIPPSSPPPPCCWGCAWSAGMLMTFGRKERVKRNYEISYTRKFPRNCTHTNKHTNKHTNNYEPRTQRPS